MKIAESSFLVPITEKHQIEKLESANSEIAFFGRSNVGKSTFVNNITARKSLARTSGKPGKTQEINLFQLRFKEPEISVTLADLPGFGFAEFSKRKREYLSDLSITYLQKRPNLKLVCILNDIRRPAEEEELALRDLLFELGRHCLVILTKCDKLNQSERSKLPVARAKEYNLEKTDFFLSNIKTTPEQFWQKILPLVE